jgi:hypothetical protein
LGSADSAILAIVTKADSAVTSACAWASAAWTAAGSESSCGIATEESRMRLIIMFWRIVSLAVLDAPSRRFVTTGS